MDVDGTGWPWLQRGFATTRWTLVKRAGSQPPDEDARDEFCRIYWHPLYAFLRRRGHSGPDAQDHVQSFFAKSFEAGWLLAARKERGKLRSYLITLLTRHVSAERSHRSALKREGSHVHTSLDGPAAEADYLAFSSDGAGAEEVFRRAVAMSLVDGALRRLRDRYAGTGQHELLDALLPALEGPLIGDSYAALAERFGMREGAIRVAAVRMRERFREFLKDEAVVALGMPRGPRLDEELRELFG